MKKITAIILATVLSALLIGCAAGSAENNDFTNQYLPEGVEFVRTEREDGFTEYKYRDADRNEYTLIVDSSENVRALEYDTKTKSTAGEVILSAEDAFAVITALYPEAVLVTAIEGKDDGKWEWNILFSYNNDLYFYELDAATGAVLDYDVFYGLTETIDPAAIITANVPDAEILEISLDTDDGRLYIEGDARTANGIVEFSIDADTGIVVEMEYDD